MIDKRLSTPDAARYLGVAVVTLKVWRRKGVGPPYYKIGRLVSYSQNELDKFLEESKHGEA